MAIRNNLPERGEPLGEVAMGLVRAETIVLDSSEITFSNHVSVKKLKESIFA